MRAVKKILILSLVLVLIMCIFSSCVEQETSYQCNSEDESESLERSDENILFYMPNFVGKKYAEEIMGKYPHMSLDLKYEYSDSIESGTVISQSVQENSLISNSVNVTLTISQGAEIVAIPNVSGMNIEDAKMQLQRVGFVYNIISAPSETVDKGCVILTNPAAGLKVSKDMVVDIYVSTGIVP